MTEDEAQIIAVLQAIFATAHEADEAGFAALITPGYYMYDGGKRFDGTALMGLIKAAYAEGGASSGTSPSLMSMLPATRPGSPGSIAGRSSTRPGPSR